MVQELLQDSSEAVSSSAGLAAALMQRLLCRLCLERVRKQATGAESQSHSMGHSMGEGTRSGGACCVSPRRPVPTEGAPGKRAAEGDDGAEAEPKGAEPALKGLSDLVLLSSEADLLHLRGGGLGRRKSGREGEGARVLNVSAGDGRVGAGVLVVANSLSWDVEQVVSVPVVRPTWSSPQPRLQDRAQGPHVCLLDGFTGQSIHAHVDHMDDMHMQPGAGAGAEMGSRSRRGKKGGTRGSGGLLVDGAQVYLLRFPVKVAALGFRSLVFGPCAAGERSVLNETGMGGTSAPHRLQPCAPGVQHQGGGLGQGLGSAVHISVEMLVQKSSGVDGYSSGAYVLRSMLSNAFMQEGLLVIAAAAGLVLSSLLTLIALRLARPRSRAPAPRGLPAEQQKRSATKKVWGLGCGVRVLTALLPLVVGGVLGWGLARLVPGAFSNHDSVSGRVDWKPLARRTTEGYLYVALSAGAWAGVMLGLFSRSRVCVLFPCAPCLRWVCAQLLAFLAMLAGMVLTQLREPSLQFRSLAAPISVAWRGDCPWAIADDCNVAADDCPSHASHRGANWSTVPGSVGGGLVSALTSLEAGGVALHLSQSLHRPRVLEIRVQVCP